MKVCSKCNIEKSLDDFHKKRNVCKGCVKIERNEKKQLYMEKANEINKKCKICEQTFNGLHFQYDSSVCKDCNKKKNNRVLNKPTKDMPDKTCTKCNCIKEATEYRFRTNVCIECEKNKMYEWRKQNPEKFKEHIQRYRSNPEFRGKINEYRRNKYNTDIIERIRHLCRLRIRQLIKSKKDNIHYNLLGCSYTTLVKWLEFNFYDDISWDNYGTVWHIDHIRPCSSFDLTNITEQYRCFNWKNLAPLYAKDNISKSNKIITSYIDFYEKKTNDFISLNPLLFK